MFIEELRSSVNLLMANLESMPVSKGGEFKLQKLKKGHNTSIMDMGQEDENTLSKSDVVLSFTLEVGTLILSNPTPDHHPNPNPLILTHLNSNTNANQVQV